MRAVDQISSKGGTSVGQAINEKIGTKDSKMEIIEKEGRDATKGASKPKGKRMKGTQREQKTEKREGKRKKETL